MAEGELRIAWQTLAGSGKQAASKTGFEETGAANGPIRMALSWAERFLKSRDNFCTDSARNLPLFESR